MKNKMKYTKSIRKVGIIIFSLIVIGSLSACASEETSNVTQTETTTEVNEVKTDYTLEKYQFTVPDTWQLINDDDTTEYAFSNGTDMVYITTVKKPNGYENVNDQRYIQAFEQELESIEDIEDLTIKEYEEYYQKGFESSALCKCTGTIEGNTYDIWAFLLQDGGNTISEFVVYMPEDLDRSGLDELYDVIDTYTLR